MKKILLLLMALLSMAGLSASAQEADALQSLIDQLASAPRSRATESPTDIDLSKYDTPRTTALEIHGGVNVRFINGTLRSADTYDGTLVRISENSTLELSETATLRAGAATDVYTGLVEMTGGTLNIYGGNILPYKDNYPWSELIETNANSTGHNYIEMIEGTVFGYIHSLFGGDSFSLYRGKLRGIHAWNHDAIIRIMGEFELSSFASMTTDKNILPRFCSELQHDITFQNRVNSLDVDNTLATGGSLIPKIITATDDTKYGASNASISAATPYYHPLTESDIDHIKYLPAEGSKDDYEVYLETIPVPAGATGDETTYAKVRKKEALSGADDLQALLNDIAARGTATESKPETITIPAGGIVLDHYITVPSKCHATLTGGPIKFDKAITGHCAITIYSNASLNLKNITLDCNNGIPASDYFYVLGGKLYVDSDVAFQNNSIEHTAGFCYLQDGGELEYGPQNSVFKCQRFAIQAYGKNTIKMYGSMECKEQTIAAPESNVRVIWCTVAGGGDFVISASFIEVTESVAAPERTTIRNTRKPELSRGLITAKTARYAAGTYDGEYIVVEESAEIYGDLEMPKLQLDPAAKLYAMSPLEHEWVITSYGWIKWPIQTPFIQGGGNYVLTQADFEKMKFENLPEGLEAYYDEKTHSVMLRKTIPDADALQEFIDHLEEDKKGTEEDPITIIPDSDGLDIDKDIDRTDDLQALIDGLKKGGKEPNKEVRFCGGNIYIRKGGCFTFTNLRINGCGGDNHIYVYGTLIIDINVYIHNFRGTFIHVKPGGRVIWRGGISEIITSEIIYNEGGTVDFESGEIGGNGGGGIINIGGTVNIYEETHITCTTWGISNGTPEQPNGTVHVYGGHIGGGIINHGTLIVDGGTIDGGDSNPGIKNYGTLNIQGGNVYGGGGKQGIWSETDFYLCGCANFHDIYIARGVRIYITEKLRVLFRVHFIVDGGFKTDTPILIGGKGYELTWEDFGYVRFEILPGYIKPQYDEETHVIVLHPEISNSDELQDFIDRLADDEKGTAEKPVQIDPAEGGIDIDKDVDGTDDLQALIDGLGNGGDTPNKEVRFCGGNIYIRKGGCFTFTNLRINGCGGDNHIYVYGTLIIDINVYIHNFRGTFIHVKPGGRVIWRGGESEITSEIIYNEGGTVDFESGEIGGSGGGIINIGGTINIYEDTHITCTTWGISNGTPEQPNGTVHVYGGSIIGGIINYGTLIVDDGTIDGGDSNPGIKNFGTLSVQGGNVYGGGGKQGIWSETDFYLCGCANFHDIHIARGVRIYITEKLRIQLNVHFIVDGGFETDAPIIIGGKGHTLTQEDFALIKLFVPDEYTYVLDPDLAAVIIRQSTGIGDILQDSGHIYNVYTPEGRKVGTTRHMETLPGGIYIVNGKKILIP